MSNVAASSALTPSARPGLNQFGIATWIFLRSLALIHLIAFSSLWVQLAGLIGPNGISPAGPFLRSVHQQLGTSAYLEFPTLAWWFGTGRFLDVLCGAGVFFALLTFAGLAPAASLTGLWICYLSLVNVGQSFLSFQWDALLLETTLFAIFLAPKSWRPGWWVQEPSWIARGLLVWLLFRLMLLSGAVKLSSGDPTWRNLTALTFHYETQPLPTPLAWSNHHLPSWFHRLTCGFMLVIELWVPWFLFAPRRLRHCAAFLLAMLQVAIALSGNYAFFNLLTIALCVLVVDDAAWRVLVGRRVVSWLTFAPSPKPTESRSVRHYAAVAAAALVVAYTSILAIPAFDRTARLPSWFYSLVARTSPFNSLNNYGLFAMMTTSRPELIFEGSDDGRDWRAYELPFKPGALDRSLPIVAPHQPRLDWQLWFAALGPPEQNPWVLSVCEHLLRGTPEVLERFAANPFPKRPPLLIRVVRYDYHFTSPAERKRTGSIWRRTPLDFYVEPASLR